MYFPSDSWGCFTKDIKIEEKILKLQAIIKDSAATEGEKDSAKAAIKRLESKKGDDYFN